MTEIVSANVGGAVAGGIVLPQPIAAGYATWPDIFKKETSDIFAILNERIRAGGEDPDDYDGSGPSSRRITQSQGVRTAGLLSLPVLMLGAAVWFFFFRR